jgi:hypothetical protein
MKIPLRELEQVRTDPHAYIRGKEASGRSEFYGKSIYLTFKRAVFHFHELGGDLVAAKNFFEEVYNENFKSKKALAGYMQKLDVYAQEFRKSKATVIKIRDRVTVPLPDSLSREITLSAEIPRLDLISNGYAVWLFSKDTSIARTELRLPLIQFAYSKKLGSALSELTVGVYEFATANYVAYQFSNTEIDAAFSELERLVKRLVLIARPKTLRDL